MASPSTADPLARLKVLLDSSTPIVVIETVEEVRAVRLVRAACIALNLAAFEWTIASRLVRCGSDVGELMTDDHLPSPSLGAAAQDALANSKAIYHSQEPAQMLGNLEAISIGAAFILKDLHRHMDEPVVVRRLRDVGQKFSENRRTIILTSPKIEIPPELQGLVEFLELPLPDRRRLRQIIDEVVVRISKDHTLQKKLDPNGFDAVVESLRGLTEEEAERALSQALVARYALSLEIATDVLETKKALLRRSEMLEFVEADEAFSNVGGMDNLKRWLVQRRGSWEDSARDFGLEPPHGVIILGVQGCGKSLCARAVAGEWNLPLVKFDTAVMPWRGPCRFQLRVLRRFGACASGRGHEQCRPRRLAKAPARGRQGKSGRHRSRGSVLDTIRESWLTQPDFWFFSALPSCSRSLLAPACFTCSPALWPADAVKVCSPRWAHSWAAWCTCSQLPLVCRSFWRNP